MLLFREIIAVYCENYTKRERLSYLKIYCKECTESVLEDK